MFRPGRREKPPVIKVGGRRVHLPTRAELADQAGQTLEQIYADNTLEHDAGCHGRRCRGQCAEDTYARWSAAGVE